MRRASKTFGIAGETVRYHLKRVNGVKRIKRTHNDLLLFGKTARMTVQDDKGVVLSAQIVYSDRETLKAHLTTVLKNWFGEVSK